MTELSVESRALSQLNSQEGRIANAEQRPQAQKVMDTVEQVQEKTEQKVEQQATNQTVTDTVEQMNQSPVIRNTSLQFVFDEKGDPPVVKVIDEDSGETIRQMPSELVVKLSKALEEMADNDSSRMGFLFDNQI